jgi:hypothetical protein
MSSLSRLAFWGLLASVAATPSWADPTFTHPLDITNPYRVFQPGAVKVFSGKKGNQLSVIVDLDLADTRTFQWNAASIPCRMIQETEFTGGTLSEISVNFSAQADDGTVYYFGELVDGYKNGVLDGTHDGSWVVGTPVSTDPPGTLSTTKPGIFMSANPMVGDSFKAEDLAGFLDETDTVKGTNLTVKTPAGKFGKAISVLETSALAGEGPGETKFYVPGIGVVKGHTKGETFTLLSSSLLRQ